MADLKKPHICFVALKSYDMLSQQAEITHVGGAEVQQYIMARWLVEHGYKISFVTLDHGQDTVEVIDNM